PLEHQPPRYFARSGHMKARAAGALLASAMLLACGGAQETLRHSVAQLSARAVVKLDVVELVVTDPVRAQRLRHVYLEIWELSRRYVVARAEWGGGFCRATLGWGPWWGQRSPVAAPTLGGMLAPPIQVGRAIYQRYTELMLEER